MGLEHTAQDYWTEPDRYSLVDAWWQERHGHPFPENLIPPVAVIVKRNGVPAAFLAAYMAVGIGVGFVDWLVTAPGQSLTEARDAALFGLEAVEAALRANGYGLLLTYARAGTERFLEPAGWHGAGARMQFVKPLV